MLTASGKLKEKFAEQQIKSTFKKREFVLTTNDSQYPQHILFQLTQNNCSLLDNVNPGDSIKVSFNLRGREWADPSGKIKYFVSLDVWKVEKEGASRGQEAASHDIPGETFSSEGASDDLPF